MKIVKENHAMNYSKIPNEIISSKLAVAPHDFRRVSLIGGREIRDKSEAFLCFYVPIFGYNTRKANVIV